MKPRSVEAAFLTSGEAWVFMRECDAKGILAGYPSLTFPYTVKYLEPVPVYHEGFIDGFLVGKVV